MKNNNSIGKKVQKQMLIVALGSIIIIGLVFGVGMTYLRNNTITVSNVLGNTAANDSKAALETQNITALRELAKSKAAISDEKLKSVQTLVEMITENVTAILKNPNDYKDKTVRLPDPTNEGKLVPRLIFAEGLDVLTLKRELGLLGNVQDMLVNVFNHNENIISVYIGTESGAFILVDKTADINLLHLDPRGRAWYIAAKEQGSLVWSDVFDDSGGRGLGISCTMPYYGTNGELLGVIGIGSLIETLNEIVIGTVIGETGYAFVLNEKGQMIISPTIEKDGDGKIIRENIINSENKQLSAVGKKMVDGESGIQRIVMDGNEYFIAFEPFSVLPWSVATVIAVNEAIKPALDSEMNIIHLRDDALSNINRTILLIVVILLALLAVVVVLVFAMSRNLAMRLTTPIITLKEGVKEIADGNLDHIIKITTGDEIEALGNSVNFMSKEIKEYIENLAHITAEKERIGAELGVATKIQASMLPCIFPAFPDRRDMDIFASMLPAKEVGGDFYDFFLIGENKIGLVIADVSGKGVPAALFMVIAKTLIKNYAQLELSTGEILTKANEQLCQGNDAGMFVTVFLTIIDLETGAMTYANAGHNPPLIKHAGGEYKWLKTRPGFVLAGMEGIQYKEDFEKLEKNDKLYLYTDGVTEATNAQNMLFSDPHLLECVNKYKDDDVEELLHKIKKEIDIFVKNAPQFDDITMLGFEWRGANGNIKH